MKRTERRKEEERSEVKKRIHNFRRCRRRDIAYNKCLGPCTHRIVHALSALNKNRLEVMCSTTNEYKRWWQSSSSNSSTSDGCSGVAGATIGHRLFRAKAALSDVDTRTHIVYMLASRICTTYKRCEQRPTIVADCCCLAFFSYDRTKII